MPRKKTLEEVKQVVLEQGKGEYTFLPPYINSKEKLEFIHKVCGTHFMMKFNAFYMGSRCPKCSLKHRVEARTKSMSVFIKEVNDCYGDGEYTVIGKYVNSDTPVKVKHNKCGTVYMSRPADLIRGHGCLNCSYASRSPKIGVNQRTPLKTVKEQINSILGSKYVVLTKDNDYLGNRQKITIKHLECGTVYQARFSDIQSHANGCPMCSKGKASIGERLIREYLSEHGYQIDKDFYYGYTGLNIMARNRLHIDFYFPKYKFAIEYDGKQHYFPINYFGGMKTLNMVKEHDKIKDDFCKKNGINLLRIPYTINTKDGISNILDNSMSGFNK